jgi:hypothetical protein
MCFSFRVSLGTFIFSWASCIYLLNKGLSEKKKQSVIFLMIFSSMQLSDAILWYTGIKKNTVNYLTTSALIPLILSLQVLYNVYIRNKNKNKYLSAFIIIILLYIFYRFNGYSKPICSNKLSSPVWGSKELQLWELILFAILILYPYWNAIAYNVFIVFPLIFILSGGGYGSLWCAIANLLTIYYLYKY